MTGSICGVLLRLAILTAASGGRQTSNTLLLKVEARGLIGWYAQLLLVKRVCKGAIDVLGRCTSAGEGFWPDVNTATC